MKLRWSRTSCTYIVPSLQFFIFASWKCSKFMESCNSCVETLRLKSTLQMCNYRVSNVCNIMVLFSLYLESFLVTRTTIGACSTVVANKTCRRNLIISQSDVNRCNKVYLSIHYTNLNLISGIEPRAPPHEGTVYMHILQAPSLQ